MLQALHFLQSSTYAVRNPALFLSTKIGFLKFPANLMQYSAWAAVVKRWIKIAPDLVVMRRHKLTRSSYQFLFILGASKTGQSKTTNSDWVKMSQNVKTDQACPYAPNTAHSELSSVFATHVILKLGTTQPKTNQTTPYAPKTAHAELLSIIAAQCDLVVKPTKTAQKLLLEWPAGPSTGFSIFQERGLLSHLRTNRHNPNLPVWQIVGELPWGSSQQISRFLEKVSVNRKKFIFRLEKVSLIRKKFYFFCDLFPGLKFCLLFDTSFLP